MILEKFNNRSVCIDYDQTNGSGMLHPRSQEKFSGIGDEFQNGFVALFVLDGKLFFQIKGSAFDFSGSNLTLDYFHSDDVTNVCIEDSGKEVFSIQYPAWWSKQASVPVGIGMDDDDEQDFFAYIKLMIGADSRKRHLIRKYT
jgi:hypothetical protein